MKLRVFSDLHVEFQAFEPSVCDADVIVLAGDIHVGNKGLRWACETFAHTPVVYVLGNHEFYDGVIPDLTETLQHAAKGSGVHILENERVELHGVTFLGCTLWTDFCLFDEPAWAGHHAEQAMADYRKVRIMPDCRRLRAADTARIHADSLAWLKQSLADCDASKTVIVTHHAPSARSVSSCYARDTLTPAYASALDEFVTQSGVPLWVHGHTHEARSYQLGQTRVVCNPRGYPSEGIIGFDPDLLIEI